MHRFLQKSGYFSVIDVNAFFQISPNFQKLEDVLENNYL